MKPHTLPAPFKLATLAAGSALLAACASAPPAYNPAQSAAQQADAFITSRDAKHAKDIKKVAITACNVMFAETSGASASTSPGLFGNVDNNRAEAKVTVLYTLAGLSDADMQKMADQVCSNAETKLAAQGYQVTSHADMKGNATFLELQKAGRESPFVFNSGQTKYKVFTRSGDSIFDERYIGTLSGLGQAFKAAKGTSAWQREAQVMDQMGVSGLNLNILIDFAELQSDGSKSLGGLANKDSANVSHKVEMSVSGELKIKPNSSMKCWERFGNRECAVNKLAVYSAFRPVNIEDAFYTGINNTTTTTDKVVSGFTKAFSLLAGGTSTDITRYQVDVQPEQFETVSNKAIDGFVEMTLVKLAEGK